MLLVIPWVFFMPWKISFNIFIKLNFFLIIGVKSYIVVVVEDFVFILTFHIKVFLLNFLDFFFRHIFY